MRELLIATTNPGKIREIRPILEGVPFRLITLADVGRNIPEPQETGATFAENARLKADYYAAATGLRTVAEDSGLAIDALGGRPGILSARYPGDTYPEKFANLYTELATSPRPWTAGYICAVALTEPRFECEGRVDGEISPEPHGDNGFGYDPIFFYPAFGRTFGEIDDAHKSIVAHRGQAFRLLRNFLAGSFPHGF